MASTHGAGVVPAPGDADVVTTGRPPYPRREPSAWRTRLYKFDTRYMPYVLISPFFILFAVFGLLPIILNGVVAFRTWRLDLPQQDGWTGFDNFARVVENERFWNAAGNTFGIFVLSTVPQLILALVIASLLNRKLRGQTWLRVGVLLPYITPITASTLVFAVFFGRDHGVANWIISFFGLDNIDWRADKWSSWSAIAVMINWRWIGYNSIIYLAAMQSIPRDIYEAAAIDGAGMWRQLWRITFPMILPVVLFTVVISTIYGMQVFTEPMLFQENAGQAFGGNQGQFQTLAMLIFQTGWQRLNLGSAAAMSWLLFMFIIVIAIFNAVFVRRLAGEHGGRWRIGGGQ